MLTKEEIARMQAVDIRTVDRNDLVDIGDVKIDDSLEGEERVDAFIKQIKNPYCYLSNGMVVKVGFKGNKSLRKTLEDSLFER